jgi:hypothetical protein
LQAQILNQLSQAGGRARDLKASRQRTSPQRAVYLPGFWTSPGRQACCRSEAAVAGTKEGHHEENCTLTLATKPLMALYKYAAYLTQNQDGAFDQSYPPGAHTPLSGIYRCMGCGREVVSEHAKPLPSQNHHGHLPIQGWRMVVWADHNPKQP